MVLESKYIRRSKLAVFDMDHTILRASFIKTAARAFHFQNELSAIAALNEEPVARTQKIARLLKGKKKSELLDLTDHIPVTEGLEELLRKLKSEGYHIGIISDSYSCITNHLKNKFGFDFTVANQLEFQDQIATGNVTIPDDFYPAKERQCRHGYCKLNALLKACRTYNVVLKNTLVIGDGENDLCCIQMAGTGISFCSTTDLADFQADHIIKEPDFKLVIPVLD